MLRIPSLPEPGPAARARYLGELDAVLAQAEDTAEQLCLEGGVESACRLHVEIVRLRRLLVELRLGDAREVDPEWINSQPWLPLIYTPEGKSPPPPNSAR